MSKNKKEIRFGWNEDGTLDEIFLMVNGECVFHLEQMDQEGGQWWAGLYGDADWHLRFRCSPSPIIVEEA